MGYFSEDHKSPRELFLEEYKDRTSLTHRILEHLLHQTFSGDADQSEPESDIILDPNPEPDLIRAALEKYRFKNIDVAYQNLLLLAQESAPFLSTRRCRHFLASIAPALLKSLRETPDPDMALMNLEKVTASLGAKTILWELFSFNPPSLKLYVDICAWSQFLSGILTNNPGMIDELLDSLVLDQPRKLSELKHELADLCKNATDLDPILHSFQDKELLRIGVRDILGKDPIRLMVASLSDLAETVLSTVADIEMNSMVLKFGPPLLSVGPRTGKPCRYAIVGLGKLGGREINYHSDLDLIILYEGEGKPQKANIQNPDEQQSDNNSFFIELTQRITKTLSNHGPLGRLYELDFRLRPTGRSGSLVIPIQEFEKYYHDSGNVQLWERLMLSRARVVHGDSSFANDVSVVVNNAVCMVPWQSTFIDEMKTMRERLIASRNPGDLKRGIGGMADVEFLVELLQIRFGASHSSIRHSNVWSALEAMKLCGLVSATEHFELTSAYDFLFRVQARLRIVKNLAIDTIPEKTDEVTKLARRLGFELVAFQETLSRHQKIVRQHYLQILEGCR
jgi:glutamate-ammonia-ligase adenylyltransferase